MAPKPRTDLPPAVHVELFVVPRSDRTKLRRRYRVLFRKVRPRTRAKGGAGPALFLIEGRPRRRMPQGLRKILHVRPDEDLWLELAFYRGAPAMRETLRSLWRDAEVVRLAEATESLYRRRNRSWIIATGSAALID